MSDKNHPHKRSVDPETRRKLRASGKAWWIKKTRKKEQEKSEA